jgi:hypothetical protein
MVRLERLFSSLILAGLCCSAQTAATLGPSSAVGVIRGTRSVSIQGMTQLLEGAPYSGEQVMQSVQILADGTRITRAASIMQKVYRDSAGRTRTDQTLGPTSPNGGAPLFFADIRDPVARVGYVLDPLQKIAYRFQLQPPPNGQLTRRYTAPPASAAQVHEVSSTSVMSDGTERKTEYLGEQTFDGVSAEGRRTTTTYPKGYQGASAPIVSTNEMWTSRSLGIAILSKTNDPRNGESTQKWDDLKPGEPDLLLFQPPADYKIVDATGPTVSISYEIQR